jgi:hypothetical protein
VLPEPITKSDGAGIRKTEEQAVPGAKDLETVESGKMPV